MRDFVDGQFFHVAGRTDTPGRTDTELEVCSVEVDLAEDRWEWSG